MHDDVIGMAGSLVVVVPSASFVRAEGNYTEGAIVVSDDAESLGEGGPSDADRRFNEKAHVGLHVRSGATVAAVADSHGSLRGVEKVGLQINTVQLNGMACSPRNRKQFWTSSGNTSGTNKSLLRAGSFSPGSASERSLPLRSILQHSRKKV